MTGNITFSMIKPTAFRNGNTGKILSLILSAGFKIKAMKMTWLTQQDAEAFYDIHKERPFFPALVEFMSGGPIIALVLEKENAVQAYRDFIGSTNPAEAPEGSIRKLFGKSIQENAVHGSDSDENAIREAGFFFAEREIY
ncbi:MAG: nucleoside-diphosphate kinase [Bacteroidetes bacterium]|nr:nucleoside-diphosphate kinase [Bacteroidota bacterium]